MLQKTLKLAGSTLLATSIVITSSASAFAYEVKPGDTLSKIARENGTTVEAIMEANNIADSDVIYVGQNLSVGNDNYVNKSLSSSDRALLKRMFDAKWYAANYPDVVKLLGNREDVLFEHFCTYGLFETRQLNADFNVNAYATGYGDLHKAFGNNIMEYYKHYESFGKKEKRDCTTIEKCLEKVGYVKSVSPLNAKGTDDKLFDTVIAKKEEKHSEDGAPATGKHFEEYVREMMAIEIPILKKAAQLITDDKDRSNILGKLENPSFEVIFNLGGTIKRIAEDDPNKDEINNALDDVPEGYTEFLSEIYDVIEIKDALAYFNSFSIPNKGEWIKEQSKLPEITDNFLAPGVQDSRGRVAAASEAAISQAVEENHERIMALEPKEDAVAYLGNPGLYEQEHAEWEQSKVRDWKTADDYIITSYSSSEEANEAMKEYLKSEFDTKYNDSLNSVENYLEKIAASFSNERCGQIFAYIAMGLMEGRLAGLF